MGLSSCKAAINTQAISIIKDVKVRMRRFHTKFTDTRGFKGLDRDMREEFYDRQIVIETRLVDAVGDCCKDMDSLQHDMGVAIDAEAD